eukprot:gene24805-biopygen20922
MSGEVERWDISHTPCVQRSTQSKIPVVHIHLCFPNYQTPSGGFKYCQLNPVHVYGVELAALGHFGNTTLIDTHRGCFALPVALYVDRDFPHACPSSQHVGVETPVPFVVPRFDVCES